MDDTHYSACAHSMPTWTASIGLGGLKQINKDMKLEGKWVEGTQEKVKGEKRVEIIKTHYTDI